MHRGVQGGMGPHPLVTVPCTPVLVHHVMLPVALEAGPVPMVHSHTRDRAEEDTQTFARRQREAS